MWAAPDILCGVSLLVLCTYLSPEPRPTVARVVPVVQGSMIRDSDVSHGEPFPTTVCVPMVVVESEAESVQTERI